MFETSNKRSILNMHLLIEEIIVDINSNINYFLDLRFDILMKSNSNVALEDVRVSGKRFRIQPSENLNSVLENFPGIFSD